MQEILEAYRVLSNPAKRKAYNLEIFGVTDRVFKTFKLTPEDEKESVSFVTYWNAAVQLQDIIDQSVRVMERASKTKTLSQKLMKKLGKMIRMRCTVNASSAVFPCRQCARAFTSETASNQSARHSTQSAFNVENAAAFSKIADSVRSTMGMMLWGGQCRCSSRAM